MQLSILFITGIVLLIYALLLLYYRSGWNDIPEFSAANDGKIPVTKISVIIPARNEEQNIPALLDSLSRQTYPAHLYEVLLIDDHSTDDTASQVRNHPYPNVKLVSLKDHIGNNPINSYKKKAVETGISISSGTLIVTSDADCIFPPAWLETIAAFYEKYRPAFIAAPVSISCSFNFIEMFQAFDFMSLQGITGASVHKKIHSMCNGANMAYEKKVFLEVSGFSGIDALASGDDMLLMHKIYTRYPDRAMFLKSSAAIVSTSPVRTIPGFLNQRIRWASKAEKYNDKRIFRVLMLVYLLNVLMLLFPLMALFHNTSFSFSGIRFSMITAWLSLFFFKIIAELIFFYPVAKFFNKASMLWLFPFMQPFHILYTVIAGWLGKFGSYKWKGRKVK